jgi:cupin fold WbuC family metalloprotein
MKLIAHNLIDELTARAAASPRGRAHHNVHEAPTDPVQRFFVVAQRNTYFRPHRHLTKSELAMVLRGRFHVLIFDEQGTVTTRYSVGDDTANMGYETPQGTWHTLVADTDGSSFFEVKQGPYDPATAAEFASWAPAEGDPAAPGFLEWLRTAQPGDKAPWCS